MYEFKITDNKITYEQAIKLLEPFQYMNLLIAYRAWAETKIIVYVRDSKEYLEFNFKEHA